MEYRDNHAVRAPNETSNGNSEPEGVLIKVRARGQLVANCGGQERLGNRQLVNPN
jgi:hypothetical protein